MDTKAVLAVLFGIVSFIAGTNEGFADPVSFNFRGPCMSVVGDGCRAFGLSEGEDVFGTLTFDESLAVAGSRLILNPSSTPFDFSFTFGDLVVSRPLLEAAALEVFFVTSDELNALSAPIPPGVLTDGSKFLLLDPARRVSATQVFALTRHEAEAVGSWLRQSATQPVPEPGTMILLAVGVTAIGVRRKR